MVVVAVAPMLAVRWSRRRRRRWLKGSISEDDLTQNFSVDATGGQGDAVDHGGTRARELTGLAGTSARCATALLLASGGCWELRRERRTQGGEGARDRERADGRPTAARDVREEGGGLKVDG